MIETISATTVHSRESSGSNTAADENAAIGFSFAAAMIALEGRASQSLSAFGATPQQNVTDTPAANSDGNGAQTASSADRDALHHSNNVKSDILLSSEETAPTRNAPAVMALPSQLAVIQQTPSQLNQAAMSPAIALQGQPATTITSRMDGSVLRVTDATSASSLKSLRATATKQMSSISHDFAKLLARRLDNGATAFELRLNPPELGCVDAHLKTDGDGKAVLSLKFEHQAALDMFARDEAGLRSMLMSSGFDLDRDQLDFALAIDTDSAVAARLNDVTPIISHEPMFHAAYSTGAVDLRV